MTVSATGCATLADAQAEKGPGGAGTIKVYPMSYDKVWDATITAVEDSRLEVITGDKEKGEILAQRSMTLFTYGENVAIYVAQTGSESQTQVEVISKKALATNITATNWEKKIFHRLDELLFKE